MARTRSLDTVINDLSTKLSELKGLTPEEVKETLDKINEKLSALGFDLKEKVTEAAQEVAEKSGINIVQATGFYQEAFLPIEVYKLSVNQLAEGMIKDIEVGIKGTNVKAGVIGEIATTKDKWTEGESKVFDAAVIASKETGCPISTHTSIGTLGHEQVRYFERQHANLSKIVIGHVDLSASSEYVIDMLKSGINVEFDTIGKNNYLADSVRVNMLKDIEDAGFTDQVVMSMDITRKSHLKKNGGNGYAYLLDNFIPQLTDAGVSEEFINKMMNNNQQRIYGDFNA